jgi:hypothetical protein
VPAAIAGTRFLRSMLVGISATESVTLVVFPLLLVAVELVAAYVPARRASKVDPTIALRLRLREPCVSARCASACITASSADIGVHLRVPRSSPECDWRAIVDGVDTNGFVYFLSTKPASTQLAKSSGLGLPASVTTRLMSRLCSGILTSKRHGSWESRITGLSDVRAPSMYTRN